MTDSLGRRAFLSLSGSAVLLAASRAGLEAAAPRHRSFTVRMGADDAEIFAAARREFLFPTDVALPTTYLNDVRFDLRRGEAGTAFITDSSDQGPNGIIVVDLATGESWRRLHEHPSTKATTAVSAGDAGANTLAALPASY